MSESNGSMKLGELFTFKNGRSFKKTEWRDSGLPIIRIQNLNNRSKPFNRFEGDYEPAIEVCTGDLLFSWSGTVGSSFGPHIWDRETGVLNQHIYKIGFKHDTDPDYAYYALLETTAEIEKGVRGAVGLVHVTKTDLKEFEIPHPPKAEQKRIVSILDEAFSAIAKAKENAEKNLANARETYTSTLDQMFARISSEGKSVELRELIQHLGDYHSNGSYKLLKANVELKTEDDYAWMVRSTDFEKDFQKGFRYVSKTAYDFLAKSQILGGEIIMSKIGNAGKVYLMPPISRPCSLAMNLFLLRLDESVATHEYTYRYLKSRFGESQIRSKLRGAATQTITKESVRELIVPLVPTSRQDEVVEKLERVENESKRLETIYTQKLANLDELKQSLLQKAFTGQLTSDPALHEVTA